MTMQIKETRYSVSKGVLYGLLGGFIGVVIMGGIASMMPIPGTGGAPFFVAAAMLMGLGSMAWTAGWLMHILTGLIVGAIFGIVVTKVSKLNARSVARGLGLGVLAGLILWIVFFLPMMAMLMPSLMSMGTMVAGSFAAHIIYGAFLGITVGALLPRSAS